MLEGHSGGRVVLILGTHLVIVDSRFCVGGHWQNNVGCHLSILVLHW